MIKLGSHVGMSAPEYFLGSVKEALSYEANAFMLYTGAPQNSYRASLEKLKIDEGLSLWKENGFDTTDIIVHLPYIINLANTLKPEIYEMGVQVLKQELVRTAALHARYCILHPGSRLTGDLDESLEMVAKGINASLNDYDNVVICLETMAGKGSEVGRTFEEIKRIMDLVDRRDLIGVCLDTCHIHDGGYDLEHFDDVLDEFDRVIGLDKLYVLHINDSKNPRGSHKDRHSNIGEGEIGFDTINDIVHNKRIEGLPMILETPYIDGEAPYKAEIEMLKKQKYTPIERKK